MYSFAHEHGLIPHEKFHQMVQICCNGHLTGCAFNQVVRSCRTMMNQIDELLDRINVYDIFSKCIDESNKVNVSVGRSVSRCSFA